METITKKTGILSKDINHNLIPQNSLFVDIETTGFMRNSNHIYLIGTCCLHDDEFQAKLFFSENNNEEKDNLQNFLNYVKDFDTLVSFNGLNFDFPFIQAKAKEYDLDFNISDYNHIDLYKISRELTPLLGLNNTKQKTIEQFLGIFREDEFTGGELISNYHNYVKHPNKEDKDLLILHNYEDVIGMIKLTDIMLYQDLSEKIKDINIDRSHIDSNEIKLVAKLDCSLPTSIFIRKENVFGQIKADSITLSFTPSHGIYKHYLEDYKNYKILNDNNTLIPKVMAQSIEKSKIRDAKAKDAFVKKDSLFIRTYIDNNQYTCFKPDIKSKELYLEFNDKLIQDDDFWINNFLHIIKTGS